MAVSQAPPSMPVPPVCSHNSSPLSSVSPSKKPSSILPSPWTQNSVLSVAPKPVSVHSDGANVSPHSWADVVKKNETGLSSELRFFPPHASSSSDGSLSPPPEVTEQGYSFWSDTLVGYFLNTPPHFSAVKAIAKKIWSRFGLKQTAGNDCGFFFFRFPSEEMADKCIHTGPWIFSGKAIFLKRWKPGMELSKEVHKRFPIWIKMSNIPLELWSHAGLCWLASTIGIPLQIDPKIARMENMSFAKMGVEVGVDGPFPSSIAVQPCSASAKIASVNVAYSWKPTRCARCQQIGHLETKCLSKFVPGSSHPKPLGSGLAGPVLNDNVCQFRMPPTDDVGNSGHLPCSVAEEARPMDLLPCPGIESEDGSPQSEVHEISSQPFSPTHPSAAPLDAEEPCGCSGSRSSIVEESDSQLPVSLKPVPSSRGLVSQDFVVPSPNSPVFGLCLPDPSAIAPD